MTLLKRTLSPSESLSKDLTATFIGIGYRLAPAIPLCRSE